FRFRHAATDRIGKTPTVADEAHAYTAAVEFVHLALQRAGEEFHQPADLVLRAVPVLAREREQRQRFDALLEAEIDADVDRTRARPMADQPRPPALLRPAAVAVHDDGDV